MKIKIETEQNRSVKIIENTKKISLNCSKEKMLF